MPFHRKLCFRFKIENNVPNKPHIPAPYSYAVTEHHILQFMSQSWSSGADGIASIPKLVQIRQAVLDLNDAYGETDGHAHTQGQLNVRLFHAMRA
jgi:hypothetical protein